MNRTDRRRVALASVLTFVAVPAWWVLSRDPTTSEPSTVSAAGVESPVGADTAPPTSEYDPEPPLFVGGDEEPTPPGIVDIAIPPAPGANETLGQASYRRYADGTMRPCTTLLAPDGTLLQVINLDNGQSTTCTNTLGAAMPAGADVVLDTAIYSEIADLTDAPVPVRLIW